MHAPHSRPDERLRGALQPEGSGSLSPPLEHRRCVHPAVAKQTAGHHLVMRRESACSETPRLVLPPIEGETGPVRNPRLEHVILDRGSPQGKRSSYAAGGRRHPLVDTNTDRYPCGVIASALPSQTSPSLCFGDNGPVARILPDPGGAISCPHTSRARDERLQEAGRDHMTAIAGCVPDGVGGRHRERFRQCLLRLVSSAPNTCAIRYCFNASRRQSAWKCGQIVE